MKKLFTTLLVSAITFMGLADTFSLTKAEQQQILNEADNWIDNMPDGLQDRLSDAVNHAMKGFFSEAEYFRNFRDTVGIGEYKVNIKNFQGGLNANIPMRLYSPVKKKNTGKLPLLIYFHGGGWSLGSLDTSERFCRALASEGNIMVISVSYPMAPENPYPGALSICESAVEYLIAKAPEFDAESTKISLGGDGAGGNLALEVYRKLPSKTKINSLVLYYPILNVTGELNASDKRTYGRGYGFDSRLWEAFLTAYNGEDDYSNKTLPPTLLISAGRDIIISDAKDFKSKHPQITLVEFTGAIHGFITDRQQKTAFKKAVSFTDRFLTR